MSCSLCLRFSNKTVDEVNQILSTLENELVMELSVDFFQDFKSGDYFLYFYPPQEGSAHHYHTFRFTTLENAKILFEGFFQREIVCTTRKPQSRSKNLKSL